MAVWPHGSSKLVNTGTELHRHEQTISVSMSSPRLAMCFRAAGQQSVPYSNTAVVQHPSGALAR